MRKNCLAIIIFTIITFSRIRAHANASRNPVESHPHQDASMTKTNYHHHHGVQVASFKLDYVKAELILALFILVIGLFKLRKSPDSYKSCHNTFHLQSTTNSNIPKH